MKGGYQWHLVNGGSNGIYSVSFAYCAAFDEHNKDSFKYSIEDIQELEKIKSETYEPTLPENPFEAQKIMRKYGDEIRAKFELKKQKV